MHLRADMPEAAFTARGLMELRIARKVACLSGIPGSPHTSADAGGGRCWFSAYESLTLTELTAGAPLSNPPPKGIRDAGVLQRVGRRLKLLDDPAADVWPIPNAALKAYGPSTKAAIVLSGVNKVLEPVTQAVLLALHDVRRQVDSPHLLVAVAHCMIQEVFAARPILFLNGIQAARVQRALRQVTTMVSRPEPATGRRSIARAEHGWPQPPYRHEPLELAITHDLWDELVARGGNGGELLYDGRGIPIDAGAGNYLRVAADDEFAQNDPVAADSQGVMRSRMISTLRHISEAVFVTAPGGGPRCSVSIRERAGDNPYTEVLIPRQRQVEMVLRRIADRLIDPATDPAGTPLPLPRLDVSTWRDSEPLQRRAAVLAHYYSLRAAGWIAGMPALNRRRSREDCADRCTELVAATEALLDADDPLRDQVTAYALGYLQQYHSTFGRGAPQYGRLLATLERMRERVDTQRGPGKAELWETLQGVLRELNTVRRAAVHGLHDTPTAATLTADLDRWWQVAHGLRSSVISDVEERSYLDHEYGTFLIGEGSDHAQVHDGLKRLREVVRIRKEDAQRSGRSLRIRMTTASLLRGLSSTLESGAEDVTNADLAREVVVLADELETHPANEAFVAQRTDPTQREISYDGAAMRLLTTLADGWVSAVRSRALPADEHAAAQARAEQAVNRMTEYLRRATDSAEGAADLDTSRVDRLRTATVRDVERRWNTRGS